MSKRFTETEIWDEDWFVDIPSAYKLFYFYLKDQCNHAGIWRPNLRIFEAISGEKIDLKKALGYFNSDKIRISVLPSGRWYLLDFFVFQYGSTFNKGNRVHESIYNIYNKEDINLTSIRGLKEVKDRVKDKDKDIDKDIIKDSKIKNEKNIIPPTIDMVKNYCFERGNNVDSDKFYNFYEAKGWMVGKSRMKDWQAAVRTWEEKKEDRPKLILAR